MLIQKYQKFVCASTKNVGQNDRLFPSVLNVEWFLYIIMQLFIYSSTCVVNVTSKLIISDNVLFQGDNWITVEVMIVIIMMVEVMIVIVIMMEVMIVIMMMVEVMIVIVMMVEVMIVKQT